MTEATVATESPVEALAGAVEESWSLPTRIAFRFCFIYFGLYLLTAQMLAGMVPKGLPHFDSIEQVGPMLQLLQ